VVIGLTLGASAALAAVLLWGHDGNQSVPVDKGFPVVTSTAPVVTPTAPVAVRTVSVLDMGAVGDGRTDDTAALQKAFNSARPGDVVMLPAGRTFIHSEVLRVTSPGLTITGGGALLATDEARSSLTIAADDVVLEAITLRISGTTRRWESYEQQRLRISGHNGVVIRDVSVEGSAAAGVYVGDGAGNFLLDRVRVSGTRADGIHMTQGAHDGRVISPVVRDVGDDGVAVVSYAPDGAPCQRIDVSAPLVDGSLGGRGVSVVGGETVTFRNIDVRRTYAAGVYVAAEGSYNTAGVLDVTVDGGSVTAANVGSDIDHGSLLVFNGTSDKTVRNVTMAGLRVQGTRPTASREVGLVGDEHSSGISDVTLRNIALTSGGPAQVFVSNSASTRYRTEGWTRDGQPLPPLHN
jgi:hypothetical protein